MDGISALMDGELETGEAQREIARLKSDGEARERWETFLLVGDTLRGEPLLSSGFNEKLSKRLAAEPTVLAPRRLTSQPRRVATYALSAAASISAAALVAWVALSPTASNAPVEMAKRGEATLQTAAQPLQSEPSDGRMNAYLLAHEGVSPSSSLQGVAPYIRTVSTVRVGEGR